MGMSKPSCDKFSLTISICIDFVLCNALAVGSLISSTQRPLWFPFFLCFLFGLEHGGWSQIPIP